jgi:hypothetical protein
VRAAEAIKHLGRPARESPTPGHGIANSCQAHEDSLGGRRVLCLCAGVDPSDRWVGFDPFFFLQFARSALAGKRGVGGLWLDRSRSEIPIRDHQERCEASIGPPMMPGAITRSMGSWAGPRWPANWRARSRGGAHWCLDSRRPGADGLRAEARGIGSGGSGVLRGLCPKLSIQSGNKQTASIQGER